MGTSTGGGGKRWTKCAHSRGGQKLRHDATHQGIKPELKPSKLKRRYPRKWEERSTPIISVNNYGKNRGGEKVLNLDLVRGGAPVERMIKGEKKKKEWGQGLSAGRAGIKRASWGSQHQSREIEKHRKKKPRRVGHRGKWLMGKHRNQNCEKIVNKKRSKSNGKKQEAEKGLKLRPN